MGREAENLDQRALIKGESCLGKPLDSFRDIGDGPQSGKGSKQGI